MRKKLFAVIMSAMMMITFMPTMAFATDGWDDNNTSYTVGNNVYSDVHKYIVVNNLTDDELQWNGQVKIAAWDNNGDLVITSEKLLGYDLSTAFASEVNPGTTKAWKSAKKLFNAGELVEYFGTGSMVDVTKVSFSMPSGIDYVTTDETSVNAFKKASKYDVGTAECAVANGFKDKNDATLTGVTFKSTTPKYDSEKEFEDQELKLYLSPYYPNATTAGYFLNDTAERPIKVVKNPAKKAADLVQADYQLDGVAIAPVNYNGAEHKLTQKTYADITSTYKMLNEKTGKYENVTGDAVVKDAGTYHFIATAVNAKDSKDKSTTYIDVTVNEANMVCAYFKNPGVGAVINVAGNFDAKKYIAVEAVETFANPASPTAAEIAKNKASAKAVKADKETILAYLNELYDVKVEDNVAGYKDASIEAKDLTAAEVKAIKAKYETFLGNYTEYTTTDFVDVSDTATFKVIDNITFSKAPLSKTYKAKKGKLPKNKTFKVKAKAASGATLVYKVKGGAGKIVVNSSTGKITCKKGLKKGTHKVSVYAITIDSFGEGVEGWIEDHYTLKIKVK